MAKNRRIPFGYQMVKGVITTNPIEVYVVSKIFAEYLKGKSLLEIAKELQAENIPYYPCESNIWNKNMIKRILENDKYLGTELYPQIISHDIYHRANNKKLKKATNICIEDKLEYEAWYLGHWHTDKRIDKMHFLFHGVEVL